MTEIEKKAEIALSSLNKSVHEVLDKKKRLGQYAVVWHDFIFIQSLLTESLLLSWKYQGHLDTLFSFKVLNIFVSVHTRKN